LTTTRRSTTSETFGGFQLNRSSGFDGNSSSSTAYLITLAKTDRLRAIVVALAAWPSLRYGDCIEDRTGMLRLADFADGK
jgi:hypothetical protein